jgi:micrococcal nuclease
MRKLVLIALTLIAGGVVYIVNNPIQPTATQGVGYQQAYCIRVVDGDTIVVQIEGKEYKVRYIGVDTPETVDPRRPVGYFGKQASEMNKTLVLNKAITLEKDVSNVDRYDRLLRYVYVGDVMINAELVRLGYAKAATYPPDVKYADKFVELEREARNNKVGLWAE